MTKRYFEAYLFCMMMAFITTWCAVITHGLLSIGMAIAAFYFCYCTLYYMAKYLLEVK